MQTNRLDAFAGQIVFWTVGDTNLDELANNWCGSVDSLRRYFPETPTPAAALKKALMSTFAEAHTLIRPTDVAGFYSVVNEEADGEKLTYRVAFTVGAKNDGLTFDTRNADDAYGITMRDAYYGAKRVIPSIAVSKMLVKIVEALGGIPLRASGGIYWLPNSAVSKFADVAYGVEAAGKTNKVYSVYMPADERTARAVVDALANEVRSEVERIGEEISADGDKRLGVRGLSGRATTAQELASKVEAYEGFFGRTLDDLKDALTTVKAAAMAAALAAAPDADAGAEARA